MSTAVNAAYSLQSSGMKPTIKGKRFIVYREAQSSLEGRINCNDNESNIQLFFSLTALIAQINGTVKVTEREQSQTLQALI